VVIVLLHVLIFEVMVLPVLRRDFNFMRNVFVGCVPEEILTR
jgi:hypothetical protein